MTILITGGLGYLGSHIIKYSKTKIVVLDNLSNTRLDYKKIFPNLDVYIEDLTYEAASKIFQKYDIKGVIHLAGSKSVDQSIINPIKYYKNNVQSSISLIDAMLDNNVNNLIFSSSATVYGGEHKSPLNENLSVNHTNPYGHTKIIIEQIIKECCKSNKDFNAISLRYFNPIGSHHDGDLGDRPLGKIQNLMPLIIKAAKKEIKLQVFGQNYPTKDGTCIRDYIHVLDLAMAHLKSFKFMSNSDQNYNVFNIGLGKGISVLELINIFKEINKINVEYEITERRKGDVAISYADNSKALNLLNWKPMYNYSDMCRDAWNSS